MPWYTTLPADWQAELEKKIGGSFRVELVLDPDGSATIINADNDVENISEIVTSIDLDPEFGRQKTTEELTITLNDADGSFDSNEAGGFFHDCCAELDRDHTAGATSIKLKPWTDVLFATAETLTINDGTNSETVTVNAFAQYNDYYEITHAAGLTYDYAEGTRIYTDPIEGRDIQVNVVSANCATKIPVFRGRLSRRPEVRRGQAVLTLSSYDKYILEQRVIGADSDADKKLMIIDETGMLKNSVTWEKGWSDPPFTWSIDTGSLPAGMTLDGDTGEIAGTPTESGEFTVTIRVTNNAGESKTGDVTIYVYAFYNEEFLQSAGLGSYTLNGSPSIVVDGACRLAFNDNRKWNDNSYDPGEPPYDAYMVLREDMGTVWSIRAKFTMVTTPADCFRVGLCAIADDPDYSTWNGGVMFGIENDVNHLAYYRLDNSKSTPWNGYEYISAANKSGTWAGTRTSFELMLRRSGSTVSAYYRESGVKTWTYFEAANETVIGVGCFCSTNQTRNIAVDVDWMRVSKGAIGFERTDICSGRVGTAYNYAVYGKGGAGEYTYALTAGALPDGLSLDEDSGYISGTPTDAGSFVFSITATDGIGATYEQEFTINIVNYSIILPDVPNAGLEDTAYSETLRIVSSGELDRTQVTVGSICPCGKWTITFTSNTAYTITGPGYSSTGSTTSSMVITDVLTIPAAAWSGSMATGDVLTFFTAISWDGENPVTAIYDVLDGLSGLPATFAGDSFTVEEDYCDDNSITLSLSVDRDMDVAQLIEILCLHFNGFFHTDHSGLAQLCSLRARSEITSPPELNEDNLIAESVSSEVKELINEIIINYAYDYDNQNTTASVTYPANNADNKSYIRNGFKKSVTLTIPGIYSEAKAIELAKAVYAFYENGPTIAKGKTNLQGMSLINGDVLTINDELFTSPGNCIVISKRMDLNTFEVQLEMADWKAFDNGRHV
jgi:hypothetical protein